MATIAAGNHVEVYVPLAGDITITPGTGGYVEFGCSSPSGESAPEGRRLYAAAAIAIPAGSTMFLRAEGEDATYTDPATGGGVVTSYTAAQLSALAAAGGLTPHATYIVTLDSGATLAYRATSTSTYEMELTGPSIPFDLSAMSAAAIALARISFYAAWTHTIVPTLGATPTHTRASVATVVDCYGVMQFCKSGEARFEGARRVCNLVSDSEGFVTGWTTTSITLTAAPTVPGLVPARRNVVRFSRASGTTTMMLLNSAAYRPGSHTFSIGLMADASSTIRIRIERSGDSATVAEATVTATGVMQRFAITGTITDTSSHRVSVHVDASGAASFYACCAQMEYADAAQEYVSVGVAGGAAPFNGANVDGVQYFNHYRCTTTDPTTRIVTQDVRGGYIPGSVLKGLLIEPLLCVNKQYSSRDPGAAEWTLTGVTAGAQSSCDLLGHLSLRKLAETATTGTHRTEQAWRLSAPGDNSQIFMSCYVQKGERDWITVGFTAKDGSTVAQAWFNLATGTVGTVSSGAEAYIYAEGDCWRIAVVSTSLTGGSAPVGWIGNADADNSASYTGTLGYGHSVGAALFGLGDGPQTYPGDTPSASLVTRVAEVFSLPWDSVVKTTDWTVSARQSILGRSAAQNKTTWWYLWYVYESATNRFGLTMRPGTFAGQASTVADDWAYDNYNNGAAVDVDEITAGVSVGLRESFRAACRHSRVAQRSSSSLGVAVNGVGGSHMGTANTTALSGTLTFYLATNSGTTTGDECPGCTTRDFRVYDYPMSDAELAAETLT